MTFPYQLPDAAIKAADAVMAVLVTVHGWARDRLLTETATKVYDHAAGATPATVRLTHDRGTGQLRLSGEYWSEGRNALALCSESLDLSATPAEIVARVNAFVEQVEDSIGETYAMRLSRPRMA